MGVKEELFLDVTTKGTAKRTGKELNKVDKATKNVIKNAKQLVAAYVGLRGIGLAIDFAKQAAAAERADKALAAYTGSVGNATRATNAMQDALGGTVSKFEATQLSTKLIALSLAETGEEAANLANKVATLGSVFGKGATPAIEEFTLLLANNSILRLDTFGISAVVVKQRIKELREETKGLTRDQAFQAATFEQLNLKAELLGDVFNDDAATYARLKASASDLAVIVGEKLGGAFIGVAESATEAAEAISTALTIGDKLDDPFLDAVRQGEFLVATYEQLEKRGEGLFKVSSKVLDPLLEMQELLILANQERQNALFLSEQGVESAAQLMEFRRGALNIEIDTLTEEEKRLLNANKLLALEDRITKAKEEALEVTIANAVLGQSTVAQAARSAIKAELAVATAGYIKGALTDFPLPVGLVLAATAGAAVGSLFDAVVPSFAHGTPPGGFVTDGPQAILVGDNPSGIERVTVEPDPVGGGNTGGVHLTIMGNVIGNEEWLRNDLLPALSNIDGTG